MWQKFKNWWQAGRRRRFFEFVIVPGTLVGAIFYWPISGLFAALIIVPACLASLTFQIELLFSVLGFGIFWFLVWWAVLRFYGFRCYQHHLGR